MVIEGKNISEKGMVIKWNWWVSALVMLFILSYIREVSFLSINNYIDGGTNFYAKTTEIKLIENYTSSELIRLKYVITILFSILFISITSGGLYFSFSNKKAFELSLFIYSIVLLFTILLLLSIIFIPFNNIFGYMRSLSHFIHNPILFIILSISAYSFHSKSQKDNTSTT